MSTFRRISLVVLVAVLAVVGVGALQSPAVAGGHNHHHNHHHAFHHGHHHHGHFHVTYPKYVNYNWQYANPILVPVTYYDCYGQPYIVWQTKYSHLPY
jgi:hypothetical protein